MKSMEVLISKLYFGIRGLLDFIHSSTSSEIIRSNHGWLESCGDDGIPPRLKELKLWSPKL